MKDENRSISRHKHNWNVQNPVSGDKKGPMEEYFIEEVTQNIGSMCKTAKQMGNFYQGIISF